MGAVGHQRHSRRRAVALDFYATNLPGDRYQSAFAQATPQTMLGHARDPLASLPAYVEVAGRTLRGTKRNAQSVVRVPLQAQLGGAYGAWRTDSAPRSTRRIRRRA